MFNYSVFQPVNGFLLDKLPKRVNFIIGSITWILSLLTFGFSTYFRQIDQYFWWIAHLSYSINAIAAALLFFLFLTISKDIPNIDALQGYSQNITSLLTVSWDLSIMYILYIISFYLKVPLLFTFIGLIVLVLVPMILYAIIMPLPQLDDEYFEIKESERKNLINPDLEPVEVEKNEFFFFLFSKDVWILYLQIINVVLDQNWIISTVYDQVLSRTNDKNVAELHNMIFSILLPTLGLLSSIIFGYLLYNVVVAFGILTLLHFIATCVQFYPRVEIQFLMYCLWIIWRISSFIFFYFYFQKISSGNKYANTIQNIGLGLAGFIGLFSILANYFAEKVLLDLL